MNKDLIVDIDGQQFAFPTGTTQKWGDIEIGHINGGLTKREYFAGLAMQAYLSSPSFCGLERQTMVELAVLNADALLKELAKNG